MSQPTNKPPVKHLSLLASLSLTDEQVEKFESELETIMSYMDQIKQLDLNSIEESARTIEEKNVWREDEVEKSFSQEQALANARRTHDGYFVVPLVLKGKD